jgi:hypothetical protein
MSVLRVLAPFVLGVGAIMAQPVQYIQQGPKLVATGGGLGALDEALEGHSVALSSDGNTAIAGGYENNPNVNMAWVFVRSGGVWSQQGGVLVGTGAVSSAGVGFVVALSANGNPAALGSPQDNSGTGAVWVFTRSDGVWSQQGGKLVGTGAAGSARQGNSVALSNDGNTLLVGAPQDGEGDSFAGAAWVFTRSGGVWTQQGAKLVGAGGVGATFQGWSVTLSGDGNTAAIGGDADNNYLGAVWVFTRTSGVWTQQGGKLAGSGAIGEAAQGWAVALSGDSNTLVVGGYSDNPQPGGPGGPGIGAAWVFTRSEGVWSQQGSKLVGAGATGEAAQGSAVALSADGNTAAIGGYGDNSGIGATWVFTRSTGVWSQLGNKLVGSGGVGVPFNQTGVLLYQGDAVAVSGDAGTILVGGPQDNLGTGAVWPFVISGPAPSITGFSPTATTAGGPQFTLTVNGDNFLPGAVVNWTGTPLETTFVSSSQLTATVPAGLFPAAGTAGITVGNPDGNVSAASTYAVNGPLRITPATLPGGVVGQPYLATLTVTGGLAPYTWSVENPGACPLYCTLQGCVVCAMPPGLTATFGPSTLTISGTPTASGPFIFGFKVTDSNLATASQTYSVTINSAVSIICQPSQLSFFYTTGGAQPAPAKCSITSLPMGLSEAVSANVAPAFNWLSASLSSTVTPTTMTVSANGTGLGPFTYAGAIQLTVGSYSTSLPVTLTVYLAPPCPFTLSGGNAASLSSAGTSTGGVLPEAPVTLAMTAAASASCSPYTALSSASWLTGTVNGSSLTYTALSNAHSTPQSATLTIANADGVSETLTATEAGDTESLPTRQVRALYQSILGRDPDAGGFTFWTGAGSAGLGQMADSFLTSPEAFNSDFAVMATYQAATGSAPNYVQFSGAVAGIRAGTQTISQLFDSLVGAGFGYSAATLYQNLLNRAATSAESSDCALVGLSACFQTLFGFPSAATPVSAANNEFQSTGSFHAASAGCPACGVDHTNGLYIAMLYYTVLGRDYDGPGYNFWLGIANAGGPGILFQGAAGYAARIQIVGPGTPNQGFIGSTEFQGLYQ